MENKEKETSYQSSIIGMERREIEEEAEEEQDQKVVV